MKITSKNKRYAFLELDFTHDHSNVRVGSVLISRDGDVYPVTKITKEFGTRLFWSGDKRIAHHYTSPHNMLTKPPFFASEYKKKSY